MTSENIKILSGGGFSRVPDPFIMVARDAETYAALREVAGQLPELDQAYFTGNAVVAAFLGTRRTGGYGVSITRAANGSLDVAASSPKAGMMTAQVITAPYQVVSVPVVSDHPVALNLDVGWKSAMRPYRVTSGVFEAVGGIAGRADEFKIEGGLLVARNARLATFAFDLKRAGSPDRALTDVATGLVQPDGQVTVPLVDPGSFLQRPRSALRAGGRFSGAGEANLSLAFTPSGPALPDGYSGSGQLSAVATAPPPKKSSSMIID